MKRRRSREFDVFSMSFLDTICCAFGAIILLFVLSKYGEPKAIEQSRIDLAGHVAKLQEELVDIRGRTEILNRELKARKIEVSADQLKLARLRGDLSSIKGQFAASKQEAEVTNDIEGQLVSAQQSLSDEMKRLLGAQYKRLQDAAIGGVPIDSEYVIFLIDTSGSMYNFHWPLVQQKFGEVLDIYPKLKGFQVMNDQGVYMYPTYRGKWLPDSPSQRHIVVDRLRTWTPYSASSPAEGIIEAVRTYGNLNFRVSIFVFGDEYDGDSIDQVVRTVDAINKVGADGQRQVRIHALGFPLDPSFPPFTQMRYSTLMRALCHRNGGAFVGLDPEPGVATR
jgi:hypothetical protein